MNRIKLKKAMVAYARKHGITVPAGLIATVPAWGKRSRTLAWRVSAHLAQHGTHLNVTTQPTDELYAALVPVPFGEKVFRAAEAEIGVCEHPAGSNDGPRVKTYQAVTGAYRQPWCASFVSWAHMQAGLAKASLPAIPAYVPSWAEAARTGRHGFKSVSRTAMRKGDFVCLWRNGHIEVFEKWLLPGVSFSCIGGNTSVAGRSSNGGMVCRTRRYVTDVSAAGRAKEGS